MIRTCWLPRRLSVSVVLLAFAVMSLGPAQAAWGVDEPIDPGDGVAAVSQVDQVFVGLSDPITDSDWGRIEVDVAAVTSGSISNGYLNMCLADGTWVVRNLPISSEFDAPTISTYFALPSSGEISNLPAYVEFTDTVKTAFSPSSVPAWPVGHFGWGAEGVGVCGAPAALNRKPDWSSMVFVPGDPEVKKWQAAAPNVQAAANQCVPMSIANSFQWLENTYSAGERPLVFPNVHAIGLKGDDTLVGKLDTYVGRTVSSRTVGDGVWFRPMVEGMLQYVADNPPLGERLEVKYAGIGYGQTVVDDTITKGGLTARRTGGTTVTPEWIQGELDRGQDVELIFSYDNTSTGVPEAGHAVKVVGAGKRGGRPWLSFVHDARQTNQGDPTDTLGTETVTTDIKDLDGDGLYNILGKDVEMRFAVSESPTTPPAPVGSHVPAASLWSLGVLGLLGAGLVVRSRRGAP